MSAAFTIILPPGLRDPFWPTWSPYYLFWSIFYLMAQMIFLKLTLDYGTLR